MSLSISLQAVSFKDEGVYNCFSRGVRSNDFAIRAVRMIVQKDWEEAYETDTGVSIIANKQEKLCYLQMNTRPFNNIRQRK